MTWRFHKFIWYGEQQAHDACVQIFWQWPMKWGVRLTGMMSCFDDVTCNKSKYNYVHEMVSLRFGCARVQACACVSVCIRVCVCVCVCVCQACHTCLCHVRINRVAYCFLCLSADTMHFWGVDTLQVLLPFERIEMHFVLHIIFEFTRGHHFRQEFCFYPFVQIPPHVSEWSGNWRRQSLLACHLKLGQNTEDQK